MYASIFIWDIVKNMALKEHRSGTRISQMELLRKKILRDFTIQCNTKIEAWRPDIAIIDKTKKEVKIVDVTIPGDVRVKKRNVGKTEKYKMLNDETKRMGGMKKVIVKSVAVGALVAMSTDFEKYFAAIGIELK